MLTYHSSMSSYRFQCVSTSKPYTADGGVNIISRLFLIAPGCSLPGGLSKFTRAQSRLPALRVRFPWLHARYQSPVAEQDCLHPPLHGAVFFGLMRARA
jgi:hypothetical protein